MNSQDADDTARLIAGRVRLKFHDELLRRIMADEIPDFSYKAGVNLAEWVEGRVVEQVYNEIIKFKGSV